jgi:pantoate--beta-alanine ligase
VATVVSKLFNLVQPDFAYFGQKDAQQVAVIKKMVKDLDFPLEVVVMPTIREGEGLAMSSRNSYLSAEEKAAALVVSRSLRKAEELFASGERRGARVKAAVEGVLAEEPRAAVEYVSVADTTTLDELEQIPARGPALVSLAVRIGKTRLIDNVILGS